MPEISIAPRGDVADKRIPGESGTWIFILGDMCVFSVFFTAFLLNRGDEPALFQSSQQALNPSVGALNTLLLLGSSLFVVFAVRAIRLRRGQYAPGLILGAWLLGAGFIVSKVFEWGDKISHDLVPKTDDFFLYYYLLTGLHLMHVVVGMGVLTVLWRLSQKPAITKYQWAFYEGGACFWHMVDLLWIVLFSLLYLVR